MKGLTEKMEKIFSAITFAEVGEFETARQIMNESHDDANEEPMSKEKDLRLCPSAAKS